MSPLPSGVRWPVSAMTTNSSRVPTELPALFDDFDLDASARSTLTGYAKGLQDWMAGILTWHKGCHRYEESELGSAVHRAGHLGCPDRTVPRRRATRGDPGRAVPGAMLSRAVVDRVQPKSRHHRPVIRPRLVVLFLWRRTGEQVGGQGPDREPDAVLVEAW